MNAQRRKLGAMTGKYDKMTKNILTLMKKRDRGDKIMKIRMVKGVTFFAALLLVMVAVMETDAFARAGGEGR